MEFDEHDVAIPLAVLEELDELVDLRASLRFR
jgi:predicted ribonuclease YlaK